jgi:hypothetical protein
MAGLRVTAISYRTRRAGAVPDQSFDQWDFIVLVTDPDGTPKTGLKLSEFTVRVHAQGGHGPFDTQANDYFDQLNQPVSLTAAVEAKYVPGVYRLEAGQYELSNAANIPYVFSVSVVQKARFGTAAGCAIVSYRPAESEWPDPSHGPSI